MYIKSLESYINNSFNFIDENIGIIKRVFKEPNGNQSPKIISISSEVPDISCLNNKSFYCGQSGGASTNWEESFMSCIGESIERYSCCFYNLEKMKKGSYDTLKEECKLINPKLFNFFHQEQFNKKLFKFEKFDDKTILFWDKCYDLTEHKYIFCPSSLIYMPFFEDKIRMSEQISTGLSFHSSKKKCVLSGIYEIIERDSFSIWWYNLLDVPKIQIEDEVQKLISSVFPNKGYKIHLFDITFDTKIPSVVSILEVDSDLGDFVLFSAATRFTIYDAIKKSIIECAQSVAYTTYLSKKNKKFKKFSDIKSFQDHCIYYNINKKDRECFEDFIKKVPNKRIDTSKKDSDYSDEYKVKYIVDFFKKSKYQIIVKDISTQDIKEYGFHVFRTIIPGFVHLNGTYEEYYLGENRLYDVPEKLGYKKSMYSQLNKMPHPFP